MSDESLRAAEREAAASGAPTDDAVMRVRRCRAGLHNYVVPRSYVQLSAKRYAKVCYQCGQTDYMDGEAPE